LPYCNEPAGWRIAATTPAAEQLVEDVEPTRAAAVCSGCSEAKLRIHDLKAVSCGATRIAGTRPRCFAQGAVPALRRSG
jgi:hypothetical protein